MRLSFVLTLGVVAGGLGCASDDASRGAASLSKFVDASLDVAALDCRCVGMEDCWYARSEPTRLECLHDSLLPFAQEEPVLFACWARAADGLRKCLEDTSCSEPERERCYADWNHLHCGRPCSTIEDELERAECERRLGIAEDEYWSCQYAR